MDRLGVAETEADAVPQDENQRIFRAVMQDGSWQVPLCRLCNVLFALQYAFGIGQLRGGRGDRYSGSL